MNLSRFTIIVPTIGRSPYLRQTIESINRTFSSAPVRRLIFWNGVPDATIAQYSDLLEDWQVSVNPERLPPHASWTAAVALASTNRVLFIGDDDLVQEELRQELDALPESDFAILGFRLINGDNRPLHFTANQAGRIDPAAFARCVLLGDIRVFLGGVVFSRDSLTAVGGFENLGMSNAWFIDTFTWAKLVRAAEMPLILNRPVWSYRINALQMGFDSALPNFVREVVPALARFAALDRRVACGLELIRYRLIFARVLSNVRNAGGITGLAPLQFTRALYISARFMSMPRLVQVAFLAVRNKKGAGVLS